LEDATALCVHESSKEVIDLDGKAENVACCVVIPMRTFTPINSGDAALQRGPSGFSSVWIYEVSFDIDYSCLRYLYTSLE
jgi:hypothetical protein